jgi:hypothetical protein
MDYDVVFKHDDKLNLWACIGLSINKIIHIFNENMDADKYIEILKKRSNLLNIYDKNSYFQYDNERVVTPKTASHIK